MCHHDEMDSDDPLRPFSITDVTPRAEPARLEPIAPFAPTFVRPIGPELASDMVDRLGRWAARFQQGLGRNEEVGAVLPHFGRALTIRLTGFGYHNPGLVAVFGETEEGGECELLQHFTQVSLLLVPLTVPEGREARRCDYGGEDDGGEDDGGELPTE